MSPIPKPKENITSPKQMVKRNLASFNSSLNLVDDINSRNSTIANKRESK